MDPILHARLREAGIDPERIEDPQRAFLALVARFGEDATLDERLALEALAVGASPLALSSDARRRATEGFYGLRWADFEIVGQDRDDAIFVVAYDPRWPETFARWSRDLDEALGHVALRIEHVGSTAVPGLAAKPIIDIQISVANLADERAYVPAIERVGASLRSRDAAHRYFRPPPERPREVHVHVCTAGGAWERDHLLFRDYLRAHEAVREKYGDLKQRLAREHTEERLRYTEGKGAFIAEALAAARRAFPGR